MPIGLTRTLTTGSIPVYQIGKHPLLAQGGFLLDTSGLVSGSILKAGHPFRFDEAARTAKPLHAAKVYENASDSATTIKVEKGHTFIVGDAPFKTIGGAAYAITAIDSSNAAYDVLTVSTTLGLALTAGDWLFASAATGASAAAFPADLKGLLYAEAKVDNGVSVSVIIDDVVVYARRVPYSADLEAALPKITYSQSR